MYLPNDYSISKIHLTFKIYIRSLGYGIAGLSWPCLINVQPESITTTVCNFVSAHGNIQVSQLFAPFRWFPRVISFSGQLT